MKFSISNIAWDTEHDNEVYTLLQREGFDGIEIAPTRVFPSKPYEMLLQAKDFEKCLSSKYNLVVASIQSIWFGRKEEIFGSNKDRKILIEYTKSAIDFACTVGCTNLVFGCPKNRITKNDKDMGTAIDFFKNIGEYAQQKGTVLAIEPNPVIYGTNFINTTGQAFEFVKCVDCDGIRVNLDLGTVIYNHESLHSIADNLYYVNHIHISEPNLVPIEKRQLHRDLAEVLYEKKYDHFVSIEMKNLGDLLAIKKTIEYVKGVFQ